jgi:putative copper resistance protein D
VTQIIDLYGFVAVVLRGLTLILEAVTVGGVLFLLLIGSLAPSEPVVIARCRRLLRLFAAALAVTAAGSALLTALVLEATTEGFNWMDATHTSFFQSYLLIAAGALGVAIFSQRARAAWLALPAFALMLGAIFTSHAFARIEDRELLLVCAGLHHLATAAWIGELPYLLIALRRGSDPFALRMARRFSPVAMVSVGVLIVAGFIQARALVGTADAIYGTAYGAMLTAKVVLLGLLLLLGATNFRRLRAKVGERTTTLVVRRLVEVETAVGITVILVASSMGSQPPAVDLTAGRATFQEIVDRFTPQVPHLRTPPLDTLSPPTPLTEDEARRFGVPLSYTPGSGQYRPSSAGDIAWSEYNHNWSGLCVLAMGLLGLIALTPGGGWARHWPLVFFALGLFILIRADPENWPLGPRGFWESFQAPEVLQHRLAVLLVAAFAIFEWRVATGRSTRPWQALVFPAICMLGGALLFTHTHALGNIKEELLAEESHTAIAIFAIVAAGARWLQLRLPRAPESLRFVWPVCFVLIGCFLTFYREA